MLMKWTNNHVEAYPGEIVSGENYLSKFVSPVEQDTRRPCSRGRRNYGYDKKRYRIKGERYDPCSREMTEVTKTDKENTRAVFNTLSGFMTPFNSFDSDQDGPQKGNRRHEFNSRDRNLDRPDEESESDERRHHDDRDRDEHGSQAPFRGNERFRVRGDRHPDGRHFHDEENRDNEYEDERQDARNRNVRVENREQDVETKNENHFVDKQHFNEDGPREDEERYDEGENEREGEEGRNFSNEGEKMTREEDTTSRFLPDEQGTSRDNLLDSNGRPMRYEKSDGVVGKFLQQTKEGDQEKSLEEKANSQQEEGDEKESALVEEQHGEVPETEVDEGAARRSESEISNRVKGMLSMIEGTDKMGSPEERKAIQKIMDASNRENELLAKSFASNVEKKVLSGERRSSEITETGNPHVSTISNYENKLLSLKHENDFATPGNHHEKEFAELSPTGGDSSISQLLGTPMNDEKISQLPEGLTETMGSAKSLITTKVAGLSFQRSLLKSLADVTPPTKQSTPGLFSSFKSQTKNDTSNLKEHLKLFMLHLNEKGTKNPDVEKQFLSHTAISSIINEVQKADHNLLNGKSKIRTKILNSKNKL
ncbi:zinc finger CCCH domain-containing protein 13-like [Clytia hemisphaerica]|uniref:Uncharacterized protein n=1 Tax=Clytia hemisphaerica TaxID=252671 RepID=A0A7M5WX28_9CNID